jgi:hypothetical protein
MALLKFKQASSDYESEAPALANILGHSTIHST